VGSVDFAITDEIDRARVHLHFAKPPRSIESLVFAELHILTWSSKLTWSGWHRRYEQDLQ
jgi:hypothetical protein